MIKNRSSKQRKGIAKTITSIIFLISLILIIVTACNTTEPPPNKNNDTITLSVEDVSSTEVWLNVKTQNITLPAELKLFREDTVTQTITLNSSDTLLYDDSLQPNKTYNYKASYTGSSAGGGQTIQSQTVTAATMDTTSHNFSWQTYTFGGANGSSVLNDVAIISENDIWAVGEIHTAETDQFDSSGVWVQPYNAVHWDGNSWELKRILFNYQGVGYASYIRAILAFGSDDIWFGIGSVIHYDGANFHSIKIPENIFPSIINSMWGTSSSDFYIVGNNGNIAHYNGSVWTKINSGTDLNINDIWGSYNKEKKEWEILCIASNQFNNEGKRLLSIKQNSVITLSADGLSWALNAIWFKSGRKYIIGGDGLYISKTTSTLWQRDNSQPPYYKTAVRAMGINDIFVVGAFGLVLHFNGYSWHNYQSTTYLNNGALSRVAIKDNIVIAVGGQSREGIIFMGKR